VAEAQQREGLSTSAETAVVRATMAQAKVDESNVRQRISETRIALMTLMSLPPRMPITIDEKLPALPTPPSAELVAVYENHALRVRPELYQQDLERHINANEIRREIASFFPKIDGIASFNWSNNIFLANPAFALGGIQVAQALLVAPTRILRLRAAGVISDVERDRTILLSLGVLYDVDLRAIQLHRGYETINSLVTQEAARKEAFERVMSLYKEGLENEAATAQALANLSLQTMDLDKARTDYQVWWYEFETAALPFEADATGAKPATAAETQPSTQPAAATQPATTQAK
jgi:outer membrane protein TolC